MISIKNVSKSFDDLLVFKNVDLDINKGDSVVIIGGSGCGKSTLLRCISRLITPDSGSILYNDIDILDKNTDIDKIREKMGMVYQQFNLFKHLNVLENVILAPMKVMKLSQEEAVVQAEELLRTVGMYEHRYHMPDELSGGQKQRVAIARTLAMRPEIILFDEPTSALDPTMVGEVENVIRKLVDSGMTSVIVTHEMRFAKNIASKVVFLAEQGIYEMGPPEEIFEHPTKPLTRQFMYRNRMQEFELEKNVTDLASVVTQMKAFVQRYEYDTRQLGMFDVIIDELIYPVWKGEPQISKAYIKLVCSETSDKHMVLLAFEELNEDPMSDRFMDDIGRKIMDARFSSIVSKERWGGGWEICIVL